MQGVLMTRLSLLLRTKINLFLTHQKLRALKENYGSYLYHNLRKGLS
jgi:hypothetical protein